MSWRDLKFRLGVGRQRLHLLYILGQSANSEKVNEVYCVSRHADYSLHSKRIRVRRRSDRCFRREWIEDQERELH